MVQEKFTCMQYTTLGVKNELSGEKCVIGNNVYLGANVSVIGDVSIGDNCVIGAGSVVVKDIPNNSVAVGVPAKIIKSIK